MWRGHRAILFGDDLSGTIIEIGKIKLARGGADFHRLHRVVEVRVAEFVETYPIGAVRVDGDKCYVSGAIIGDQPLDPLFVGLGRGAMIARENDRKDFRARKILQTIATPVDGGQVKFRSGRADSQGGIFGWFPEETQFKEQKEDSNVTHA